MTSSELKVNFLTLHFMPLSLPLTAPSPFMNHNYFYVTYTYYFNRALAKLFFFPLGVRPVDYVQTFRILREPQYHLLFS